MTTTEILNEAISAKASLAVLSTEKKNEALLAMADALVKAEDDILENNRMDIESAQHEISKVMVDRLLLNHDRIADMADGIRQVAALPDPIGIVEDERVLQNGLSVKRVSVPMGVVAIIYESRPNVTSDAAALSLKSGNVCVLRCGKEAHYSATAIIKAMRSGLASVGLPETYINILEDTSREGAEELMTAVGKVDLLIPRGGAGLIRSCVEKAKVPCIQTGTGICHVYVDRDADLDKALNIIENAKTSRPSVCNAEEVCLVARSVAAEFLPRLKKRLVDDRVAAGKVPVELRLDKEALAVISGTPAGDADFDTEFLNYILAVGIVEDVEEAISHIGAHSTHHSDAIVTENKVSADRFVGAVDSAAVYVNASTRFTDGGQFGLGCEIGISTQKLHARGPMGLREMTSYKYVIVGCGQIR